MALLTASPAGAGTDTGVVRSWGDDRFGQLGTGLPLTARAVAAGGYFSMAVDSKGTASEDDDTVVTWGDNRRGQWGNGVACTKDSLGEEINCSGAVPQTVLNVVGVHQADAGFYYGLALLTNGTVKAWGDNSFGQLGDGAACTTPDSCSYEVAVTVKKADGSELTGIKAIAAGGYHALALDDNNTVWAWGYNGSGQLGVGDLANRNVATPVKTNATTTLTGVNAIAAGGFHSLGRTNGADATAATTDDPIQAWGDNASGQLGDGTTTNRSFPVTVGGSTPLLGMKAIAAGQLHSLAIDPQGTTATTDDTATAWGNNELGQLGDGTQTNSMLPVNVADLIGITDVAGGGFHSAAVAGGTAYGWGDNGSRQADNTTAATLTASPVKQIAGTNLTGVTDVDGGYIHTLALRP
ncbi:MAG: hypothetical protein M3Q48_05220 [Actinomycetota bacterium]|nr:hypothetical protein [Actinomycetota bacterium]